MSKYDDIKRCPFCGSNDVDLFETQSGSYCGCSECGAYGPDAALGRDAVRMWNVPVSVIEDLHVRLRGARGEI